MSLQAVQEFGALCREKEVDVLKGVLPFWPRVYSKLVIVSSGVWLYSHSTVPYIASIFIQPSVQASEPTSMQASH